MAHRAVLYAVRIVLNGEFCGKPVKNDVLQELHVLHVAIISRHVLHETRVDMMDVACYMLQFTPSLYKLLGSAVARVARIILGNTEFWLAGGPEVLQGCYTGATCSMLHPSCLLVFRVAHDGRWLLLYVALVAHRF